MSSSELFWESAGTGGDAVLLIHGILSDHTFFRELAAALSPRYRTVCYDRRGYGGAPWTGPADYSVKTQAGDALAVLRASGGGPAWVLGHSAGAVIALALAMERPEAVKGLILIEPGLGLDPADGPALRAWNEELNGYAREGKITRAFPAFFRAAGARRERRSGGLPDMAGARRARANLTNFMYGELNEIQRWRPDPAALAALTVPVIVGLSQEGEDNLFRRVSARDARVMGWPTESFPGGHDGIETRPQAFGEKLAAVLSRMGAVENSEGDEL